MSDLINKKTQEVDAVITRYLPKEEGLASTVINAMNYSINVGGKRIRPMLMMETYRMFSGADGGETLGRFMAAIEMIHTYSLCHDDLPAMDNDDLRRGMPSTPAKFGEAMGILAGDALLNYAFEVAIGSFFANDKGNGSAAGPVDRTVRIAKALSILAKKAGIYGMIAGQVADIEAEDKEPSEVTQQTIDFIHENKTAAMIESSLMIGAVLAGADDEQILTMEQIGSDVGLAFQIRDDILDVTGGDALGKPIGSDERNGKATYVTLNGLDKAIDDVKKLTESAVSKLSQLPGSGNKSGKFLSELIESLAIRDR